MEKTYTTYRPTALPDKWYKPQRQKGTPPPELPIVKLMREHPELFLPDLAELERLSQPEPAMPPSEG